MLFYANHPFEGARVLACPCMTESYEKKFYGEDAVFIYDKDNDTNRPVRGVHNNVIRRWMLLPAILREAFITEFSKEKLNDPQKRITEREWVKIIQGLRDMLVVCPHCGEENFVENAATPKCMACKRDFSLSGILQIKNRSILLTPKSKIYIDLDNKPDIMVFAVPGDKYPVQMRNVTAETWIVETQSGKLKQIQPNETMPVRAGLKITIGQDKGQIV
jgi:DNA-directed RNA polymerase subunit RPC12/RpoP